MANPNPSPSTRFKVGQVGNPNGGRRGPLLTTILREALSQRTMRGPDGKLVPLPDNKTVAHFLVDTAIKHGAKGNAAILKEIWARIDGVQPTQIDLTAGGHPAGVTLSALSPDELDTYEAITRKLLAGRSDDDPGDDRGGEVPPEPG